jgi:hypothetical protein
MDSSQNLHIGVINPYALTESLMGRSIDWTTPESARILSAVLGTKYNELFDMKHRSPLYAGLKIGSNNMAEPLKQSEMHVKKDRDLELPNLSTVEKVADLEKFGVKDVAKTPVERAWVEMGKLNLVLDARELDKRMSNVEVNQGIFDLSLPFRKAENGYTPPNTSWIDMDKLEVGRVIPNLGRWLPELGRMTPDLRESRMMMMMEEARTMQYNDPIQGAIGNSYLIAAIAAAAWADPSAVVHRKPPTSDRESGRTVSIHFHSKGGHHDAPTATIEVSDKILVDNATKRPVYSRSNDFHEMYSALYEKAYAKWITRTKSDEPDITQTAFGNPVVAAAQITDRTPHYFETRNRSADDLYGIVREHSLNFRTMYPMVAWTHPTGPDYCGANVVANNAYTVLGWAYAGGKSYIVLRNCWGVTEPRGLNTYQGLISFFDETFWHPISTVDHGGVFALEPSAFKYYFAGLGVAK